MSDLISNEIVQIYIPVIDIRESVDWYVTVFGFTIIAENEEEANLKANHGPLLFLTKVPTVKSLTYTDNGREWPIVSFKTSDLDRFYKRMQDLNIHCGEIDIYGEGINGPYRDLEITDPNGHIIQVNSFLDLILPKFRGY
jgi:catechol 2,3-dioxygenase-like lactoylglutathione lyase family enzyme